MTQTRQRSRLELGSLGFEPVINGFSPESRCITFPHSVFVNRSGSCRFVSFLAAGSLSQLTLRVSLGRSDYSGDSASLNWAR